MIQQSKNGNHSGIVSPQNMNTSLDNQFNYSSYAHSNQPTHGQGFNNSFNMPNHNVQNNFGSKRNLSKKTVNQNGNTLRFRRQFIQNKGSGS